MKPGRIHKKWFAFADNVTGYFRDGVRLHGYHVGHSRNRTVALVVILPSSPKVLLEDNTMGIAGQTHFEITRRQVENHGAMIFIGYSLIALLIVAIYFGSMSPGTAAGDFASMVAFP
jgi:hypothetical protein